MVDERVDDGREVLRTCSAIQLGHRRDDASDDGVELRVERRQRAPVRDERRELLGVSEVHVERDAREHEPEHVDVRERVVVLLRVLPSDEAREVHRHVTRRVEIAD